MSIFIINKARTNGYKFSYPASAATVVFGVYLSAQPAFRIDRKSACSSHLSGAFNFMGKAKNYEDNDNKILTEIFKI